MKCPCLAVSELCSTLCPAGCRLREAEQDLTQKLRVQEAKLKKHILIMSMFSCAQGQLCRTVYLWEHLGLIQIYKWILEDSSKI